jgi:hypothetical protein
MTNDVEPGMKEPLAGTDQWFALGEELEHEPVEAEPAAVAATTRWPQALRRAALPLGAGVVATLLLSLLLLHRAPRSPATPASTPPAPLPSAVVAPAAASPTAPVAPPQVIPAPPAAAPAPPAAAPAPPTAAASTPPPAAAAHKHRTRHRRPGAHR